MGEDKRIPINSPEMPIEEDYHRVIEDEEDMEKEQLIKKNNVIAKICHELDHLYDYALKLIPKGIIHNLGYKKELLKGIIEDLILVI